MQLKQLEDQVKLLAEHFERGDVNIDFVINHAETLLVFAHELQRADHDVKSYFPSRFNVAL